VLSGSPTLTRTMTSPTPLAFYERLWVDEGGVTEVVHRPPFGDIHSLAKGWDTDDFGSAIEAAERHGGRSQASLEPAPVRGTMTALPGGPSLDRVSSKAALVELARRYSNRPASSVDLARTWSELQRELGSDATPDDTLRLRSATAQPGRPHALSRRLAPDTVSQLVSDYRAGASSLQLARRYGISKASVLAVLDQHGVKRRHQPLTGEQVDEAIELYESGLSVEAVSKRLGTAGRTVHRSLTRAGVAMRDTQGRPRPQSRP